MRVTVHLPENWEPALPERRDSLTSPFGTWQTTWDEQERTLLLTSGYVIAGVEVPPDAYPAFRRFLDSVRVRDQQELVLVRQP
jgi:hypothetical protein